jgi:hypothetical protein
MMAREAVAEVEPHVQAERQRAARALLQQPLLSAESDLAAFALVRRHQDWLRDRFEHLQGYRLAVRTEHARLHKRTFRTYRDRGARVQPTGLVLDAALRARAQVRVHADFDWPASQSSTA